MTWQGNLGAVVAIDLTPKKALIFRITHINNLPWILENGLHCRNSRMCDENFTPIGNQEIIDKRHVRKVKIEPFGTLSDYVPFYFTPKSIMAYNIKTGYNGITTRKNSDIVVLVSSLLLLEEFNIRYVFTNKHAVSIDAKFYSSITDVSAVDWGILSKCDFARDNEDIDKTSRYQAEALVHNCFPLAALAGIACYNAEQKEHIDSMAAEKSREIKVAIKGNWYF